MHHLARLHQICVLLILHSADEISRAECSHSIVQNASAHARDSARMPLRAFKRKPSQVCCARQQINMNFYEIVRVYKEVQSYTLCVQRQRQSVPQGARRFRQPHMRWVWTLVAAFAWPYRAFAVLDLLGRLAGAVGMDKHCGKVGAQAAQRRPQQPRQEGADDCTDDAREEPEEHKEEPER
eukprot:4846546-Pleurochrysis_carterae.AAC.5